LFTTKVLFSATDVYFYQNRCIDFYFSPVAAIAKYSYAPDPHAQNKKLKHFINKKTVLLFIKWFSLLKFVAWRRERQVCREIDSSLKQDKSILNSILQKSKLIYEKGLPSFLYGCSASVLSFGLYYT